MMTQRPQLEVSNLEIALTCARIAAAFMVIATVAVALLAAIVAVLVIAVMIIVTNPGGVLAIPAIAGCVTIWLIVRRFNHRHTRRRVRSLRLSNR